MQISTISIDLAKSVFQLMMFDNARNVVQEKRLNRAEFYQFVQEHPPCAVVMEACGSAHYWAQLFEQHGFSVKLIPPQHVRAFVRGNKNDRNDALAIYEASERPFMRPVPIKTPQQQEVMMLHRVRERLVQQRVALTNQTRGLLSEIGVVFAKGNAAYLEAVQYLLDGESLSAMQRVVLLQSKEEYQQLSEHMKAIEQQLRQYVQQSPAAQLLQSIPGIGVLNASAFAASIDKGQAFKNAKEFAVWLGLTPTQYASGLKSRNGTISKRGDRYLRTLLIHGARSLLKRLSKGDDDLSRWFTTLRTRMHLNGAIVALAHRLARLMWTLLSRGETYRATSNGHEAPAAAAQ